MNKTIIYKFLKNRVILLPKKKERKKHNTMQTIHYTCPTFE